MDDFRLTITDCRFSIADFRLRSIAFTRSPFHPFTLSPFHPEKHA